MGHGVTTTWLCHARHFVHHAAAARCSSFKKYPLSPGSTNVGAMTDLDRLKRALPSHRTSHTTIMIPWLFFFNMCIHVYFQSDNFGMIQLTSVNIFLGWVHQPELQSSPGKSNSNTEYSNYSRYSLVNPCCNGRWPFPEGTSATLNSVMSDVMLDSSASWFSWSYDHFWWMIMLYNGDDQW